MKLPKKEATVYYIYGILSVCLCILFTFFIKNLTSVWNIILNIVGILSPFIIGFGIAFVLNPVQSFLENKIFRHFKVGRRHPRIFRAISIAIIYFIVLALVSVFFIFVTPEIVESIKTLIGNGEQYVKNITDWFNSIFNQDNQIVQYIINLLPDLQNLLEKFLNDTLSNIENIQSVFEFGKGIANSIINIFIGVIISIYILADKDRFKARSKKMLFALFNKNTTDKFLYWLGYSSGSFTGYISGKILDSLIIGTICFIFMKIFNWPFAMLISVIVGITNLIPFFGPFIGAIPSAILIFIIDPITALWFILFIIALQQIDGNIIGPLIVGDSVGLSAFWIIFSILFFGGLFGLVGMLLGIPVFAVIYAIIKTLIENRLTKKGLSTNTSDYLSNYAKKEKSTYTHKKKFGNKLKDKLNEFEKSLSVDDDDDNY